MTRKGSIKETGEELSQEQWKRFDAAVGLDATGAGPETTKATGFRVVREGAAFQGKQGHIYRPAISAEAVGAQALHMQLLEIPPGERAHAHKHAAHETAIHVLKGVSGCFWGERLEHHAIVGAGDFCYIAADMPHLPYNRSDSEPVIAVIARTDPNEQESVVLLPELEAGVDWSRRE